MNKDMLNNELSEEQGKPYGIVYKATNKHNGKSYIGITTTSLKIRRNGHQSNAKNTSKPKNYFLRALQKYGIDGFIWEEIDNAYSINQLYDLEIKWIKAYGTYGDKGYNMTHGGEGTLGLVRSSQFVKEKSELVHRLRKEGKMGNGNKPKILDRDVLIVRDLILKGIKLNCIASVFDVGVGSVLSLKTGTVRRSVLTDKDLYDMSLIREGLNVKKVMEIKELIIQGNTLQKIANIYDVNRSAISSIKTGRTWRHIFTDEDMIDMNDVMPIKPKRILTEDELFSIKQMLLNKQSPKDIASHINCRPELITNIKNGNRHSHLFTPEELEQIKYKPKSHKINKDT